MRFSLLFEDYCCRLIKLCHFLSSLCGFDPCPAYPFILAQGILGFCTIPPYAEWCSVVQKEVLDEALGKASWVHATQQVVSLSVCVCIQGKTRWSSTGMPTSLSTC